MAKKVGPYRPYLLPSATQAQTYCGASKKWSDESLGWQPKERSPSLAPDPLIRRVVNELLWVAAKRTFTIPGPWPLVSTLSVQGRERVAGVAAKRTFTVPGPWPL